MSELAPNIADMESGTKSFRPDANTKKQYPAYVDRWALVVGISDYADDRLELKYADRDACVLCNLLQQPAGGAFNQIKQLLNEKATTANVIRALRTWLKQPKPEDIVLIYFSCHGAPDPLPGVRSISYLLTHDTDIDDISGTALRMDAIQQSLRDYLRAERVVVIIDTCHSGAVAGGLRGSGEGSAELQSYLKAISAASPGVALLTSAAANEAAREDEKWGGGHGVLTHFLLEGIGGAADGYHRPKDGKVTVGELFDYVRDNVQQATNYQQNPAIPSTEYDPDLPMAITAGIQAAEHIDLGEGIYKLGWLANDKGRFESAVRQFERAIDLSRNSGRVPSQAVEGLVKALIAAQRDQEAIQALQRLAEYEEVNLPVSADYYCGVAYEHLGRYEEAIAAFERFLISDSNHPNAASAREHMTQIDRTLHRQRFALLIGIDRYKDKNISDLRGCVHDVERMSELLDGSLGFDRVVRVVDKQATRSGILNALQGIANEQLNSEDTVLIHISGWGFDHLGPQMLVHDTLVRSNIAENGITPHEMHEALSKLGGTHKLVIFDAKVSNEFANLATTSAHYVVLSAAEPATLPLEVPLGYNGQLGGVFTSTLIESVGELTHVERETLSYADLVSLLQRRIKDNYRAISQKPSLLGNPALHIFTSNRPIVDIFELAQRQTFPDLTVSALENLSALARAENDRAMSLHASFGRAFLEKGMYAHAIESFQTAMGQAANVELELELALAQTASGKYSDALSNLTKYLERNESHSMLLQPALDTLPALQASNGVALLVGINEYINPDIPALQGAVNDVDALERVLTEHFGFHVRCLRNHEATRQRVFKEFTDLVDQSSRIPALFYFAGYGSVDVEDKPTILAADGRQPEIHDISLVELARSVPERNYNLITIFDAGWSRSNPFRYAETGDLPSQRFPQFVPENRNAPADEQPSQLRGISLGRDPDRYRQPVGQMMCTNGSLTVSQNYLQIEATEKEIAGGNFTRALVQCLQQAKSDQTTYRELKEQLEQLGQQPAFIGNELDSPCFDRMPNHHTVWQAINQTRYQPIRKTVADLERLLQDNHDPDSYVNLGVAYGYMGEYDQAIEKLKTAVSQQSKQEEQAYHAHYHLGRILVESRRELGRAIEELEAATHSFEGDEQKAIMIWYEQRAATYFYLGEALRLQAEQDILTAAEQAYDVYLQAGAPLGHKQEVRDFLVKRQAERTYQRTR